MPNKAIAFSDKIRKEPARSSLVSPAQPLADRTIEKIVEVEAVTKCNIYTVLFFYN